MKVGDGTTVWHPELSVLLDFEAGEGCVIHAPVWIGNGVVIGDRCKIQAFSFIPEGVTIEDDVFIGPRVTFTNDKYPPASRENWKPTLVEYGVVIGAGAIILPGLTLGADSTVGAGAVVTHDVAHGSVVVGNPARAIA